MNISAPFIRRPVATSLLTAALLLYGSIAFRELPVASLPQVAYPVIQVEADLPGASAETQASAIATPLERMFGRIAGVNQMTSLSRLGKTQVVLQFDLDRDIDAASRDVQAAINSARGQLPTNLPTNPSWRKVNPAEAPVMVLALTSDTATQEVMFDAADSVLAQKLQQIAGIGQVQVGGSSQPAVRAEVNPLLLSKLGISLDQVRNSINDSNAHLPKGSISDGAHNIMLNTNDQLFRAAEYGPLVIAYNNQAPVRLSDVATVVDSQVNILNTGLINGKPLVELDLYRQPDANIIDTVDGVKAVLPLLRASIPPSIKLTVAQDRTITIRASVHDVEVSLVISIVLVVLVIFAFLHSIWATAIPGVAVPVSLVGTFGVMYLLGYSIDNLSLMALTISTGFVVDDAIVVIENITRYLEKGMTPLDAALEGAKEIGFTVLSMSVSLIAVFIPILMMGGILGRIFREFAITLAVAVAISLVVSLTATPMMCAKLLKRHDQNKQNWLSRTLQAGFDGMAHGYASSLRWAMRRQALTLCFLLGTVCLAIYLYVVIPKGFFPQQDTGRLSGIALGAEDVSFKTMRQKLAEYITIIQSDPAVDVVTGGIAVRANQAVFNITLKPLEERKVSADQVINRLRPRTARIPGSNLILQAVQDVQIGGRVSNAQFQYTLQADRFEDLLEWAPRVLQGMKAIPGLLDVNNDLQNHALETGLVIDRDTASRLGITPASIDSTLDDAFGQRQVSTMYTNINQYFVVMEVDPQFQSSPDGLNNIYLRSTSAGKMVPLTAFTHTGQSAAAISIAHQGPLPAVTFFFNLALNTSLGEAVKAIQNMQNTLGLPSTIHASFQGTTQAFQDSLNTQLYLILAALITVYIVLGILYENCVHPITILSTLPSAGVGALLALMMFKMQLSVIALIGIILLVGIVKKNAILMIDFAIQAERNENNRPEESIYHACLLRFRPIMMTTIAAMFGGIPIAISNGNGAELRRPLGIAIVGGLLVSQMLTLYTTPVVYVYMDRLRGWISGGKMHALDVIPPKISPTHD